MKHKIITSFICLFMLFCLTGCSGNSKKELVKKFENEATCINSLSNDYVKELLDYSKKNESFSFIEVVEGHITDGENSSDDAIRIIKKINETWEPTEIGINNNDNSDKEVIIEYCFDSVFDYSIVITYNYKSGEISEVSYIANPKTDDDSKASILQMMRFIMLVDRSFEKDSLSTLEIIDEARNNDLTSQNQWDYTYGETTQSGNLIISLTATYNK